jgi:hypothetical protein
VSIVLSASEIGSVVKGRLSAKAAEDIAPQKKSVKTKKETIVLIVSFLATTKSSPIFR